MSGFIQLSREFFKTKEWREGRSLSDAEAMLYMISKAGFEAKTELYKGKTIYLQAGELRASERFLAEEWGWNRNKAARFLDRIEQTGYIRRRTEKGEGIIGLKRFIVGLESTNESESESAKQKYNSLVINNLPYSCDSGVSQQTSQKASQPRVSCEPPINNKENNKNNLNKKKKNPPYPPYSEELEFVESVESPKKESEALEAEREEKEKSCAKKEKEIRCPFEGDKFKQAWALWKKYRQEHDGFKYKSRISEQTALKQLKNQAQGNEATAAGIIEQSIARGWQGFYDLKDSEEQNRLTRPTPQLSKQSFDKNR